MFARLSGRTKRRKRSASGMEENVRYLRVDPIFGPVRMLVAKSRRFQFARQPVELLRRTQTLLARHGAQRGYLFRTWPFVGEHDQSVVEKLRLRNAFAVAAPGVRKEFLKSGRAFTAEDESTAQSRNTNAGFQFLEPIHHRSQLDAVSLGSS